jgi:hypothetical protein
MAASTARGTPRIATMSSHSARHGRQIRASGPTMSRPAWRRVRLQNEQRGSGCCVVAMLVRYHGRRQLLGQHDHNLPRYYGAQMGQRFQLSRRFVLSQFMAC